MKSIFYTRVHINIALNLRGYEGAVSSCARQVGPKYLTKTFKKKKEKMINLQKKAPQREYHWGGFKKQEKKTNLYGL